MERMPVALLLCGEHAVGKYLSVCDTDANVFDMFPCLLQPGSLVPSLRLVCPVLRQTNAFMIYFWAGEIAEGYSTETKRVSCGLICQHHMTGGGAVRLLILWAMSGSCLYPLKLNIIHRYGSYAWGTAMRRYHLSLHPRHSSSTCFGPKQKSSLFIPCLTGAVWRNTVEPEIMAIMIIVIMLPDISTVCWISHNTPGLIQSCVKHARCLIKPFLPLIHTTSGPSKSV